MSTKTLIKTGNGWRFYKTELFRLEPNSVDIISGYSFLLWFLKRLTKSHLGKGLLELPVSAHYQGNPKQELGARNSVRDHGSSTFPACFLWAAQLPILYNPSPPAHASLPHSGLDLQLAIKNCPADIPTGQLNGDNSFTKVPSSRMCQVTARISPHRYVEIDFEILIMSFVFILISKLNQKKICKAKICKCYQESHADIKRVAMLDIFPTRFPFIHPHLLELWKESQPVIQIFHKKDHEEINRTKFICNYNSICQNQNTILWSFKLPLLPVLQDASHLKLTSQAEFIFPQSSQVNSIKIESCRKDHRFWRHVHPQTESQRLPSWKQTISATWKQDVPVLFLLLSSCEKQCVPAPFQGRGRDVTAKPHSSCKPET